MGFEIISLFEDYFPMTVILFGSRKKTFKIGAFQHEKIKIRAESFLMSIYLVPYLENEKFMKQVGSE